MYKKKTGIDLDDPSARAMQGLLIMAEAINRAGSTDPAKIQAALKATDLKANQVVTGYNGVKFDEKGQNVLGIEPDHADAGRQVRAGVAEGQGRGRDSSCPTRAGSHAAFDIAARGASDRLEPRPEHVRPPPAMSSILLQVIVSGLLIGAVYALFSSGLTLIWGMMNVVNFAHGDFVMLAMYTAFVVWTAFGGGPLASVPVAALVLATVGILSYFLLVRHIMKGPMLAQILGTFGLALLLRYSAFWYFGANFKTLPDNILGPPFVFGSIARRCAAPAGRHHRPPRHARCCT